MVLLCMSTTVDRQPPQVVSSSRRAWVINRQTGIVGYSLTLTVTLNGGAYMTCSFVHPCNPTNNLGNNGASSCVHVVSVCHPPVPTWARFVKLLDPVHPLYQHSGTITRFPLISSSNPLVREASYEMIRTTPLAASWYLQTSRGRGPSSVVHLFACLFFVTEHQSTSLAIVRNTFFNRRNAPSANCPVCLSR